MSESAANKVVDKVKETAVEEANRLKDLANEAFQSNAYIYPIKGIYYFLAHKDLWRPLFDKLAPTITTAIGVTTFMFLVSYVPQAAILSIFNGPLAIATTVMLVLSESSTITNVLARSFFIEDALLDTFDATLLSRGMTSMVSEGRQIKSGGDSMARLGKLVKKPFAKFTPKALIRYLMYLPLNFIPLVGTVLFVILQGRKAGPMAHARYFQLKQMSKREKEEFVEKRQGAYTSFGVPATLLELIPFIGIAFTFTNACGAALWAADMEAKKSTAPQLRLQADLAKKPKSGRD